LASFFNDEGFFMQKAILSGHRQAELIDVPDPQAKED